MRSERALFRALLAGVMIGLFALAGCGKKGPLEAPPGAVTTEPAPVATGPYGATGTPTTAPATEPVPEQHEPFALDVLL